MKERDNLNQRKYAAKKWLVASTLESLRSSPSTTQKRGDELD